MLLALLWDLEVTLASPAQSGSQQLASHRQNDMSVVCIVKDTIKEAFPLDTLHVLGRLALATWQPSISAQSQLIDRYCMHHVARAHGHSLAQVVLQMRTSRPLQNVCLGTWRRDSPAK